MNDWLEPLQSFETKSFIVVVQSVARKEGGEAIQWRGSVEHTQSREHIYFIEFSGLNEFIAAHCGTPSPRLSWRKWVSQRWKKLGLDKSLQNLKTFYSTQVAANANYL